MVISISRMKMIYKEKKITVCDYFSKRLNHSCDDLRNLIKVKSQGLKILTKFNKKENEP